MTKVDLADRVYEKLGSYTKEQAFDLVEITLEVLNKSITTEGRVKIVGFGRFVVREKAARKGRIMQQAVASPPITSKDLVLAST